MHFTDCCPGCLKNALFMVGLIGSNDYNFALSMGQTSEDAKKLVPDIVEVIMDAVRVSRVLHNAFVSLPAALTFFLFIFSSEVLLVLLKVFFSFPENH